MSGFPLLKPAVSKLFLTPFHQKMIWNTSSASICPRCWRIWIWSLPAMQKPSSSSSSGFLCKHNQKKGDTVHSQYIIHQDSVFTSSSSHNKTNARLEHMSTDDWRSWIHTLTRLSSILSVCVWIHVFRCRRHVFVVSCRTDSVQLLSVCLAVGCFTELYLAYTHHCFFFLFLQRLGHLASIHLSLSNMCSSLNGSVHLTRSSMHTSSHRAGIRLNSFYWQMLRVSECLM